MGGELTEGVGEQKPALHDQNTSSNFFHLTYTFCFKGLKTFCLNEVDGERGPGAGV